MLRVLISPWGNFKVWRETTYLFNGRKFPAKSTLPVIKEEIKPDASFIILPDTLTESFENYKAVVTHVKNEGYSFLKELGVKDVEIIVAPGSGSFQNGRFIGDMMDFYNIVLYELSTKLPKSDLEVHLDVTHGLNYMTLMTYRVVKEILETMGIYKKVSLIVYNSEPPIQDQITNVHIVEKANLFFRPSDDYISSKIHLLDLYTIEKTKENYRKLNEEELYLSKSIVKRCRKMWNAWMASLYFGFPLVFTTFFPESNDVKRVIDDTLRVYKNHIEIKDNTIKRNLKFGDEFKIVLKLHMLINLVPKIKKNTLSIQEIREIGEKILDQRAKAFLERELNSIEKEAIDCSNRNITFDWKPLRCLLKIPTSEVIKRNFMAHAGLECNITEVKLEKANSREKVKYKTFLRYSEDKKSTIPELVEQMIFG